MFPEANKLFGELLAKKMRMIKNFGRRESGKDNFEVFGINLKFTDLQAVIGIEQMKKLPYRVERKKEIYKSKLFWLLLLGLFVSLYITSLFVFEENIAPMIYGL